MDRTSVLWIIDQHLLDRALPTGRPNLADALREAGNEAHVCGKDELHMGKFDIDAWIDRPVISYGSLQFVNKVTSLHKGKWQPGSFIRKENLSYSGYSPYLGDLMLNDDFILLPYAEFKRRGLKNWGGRAFIRPNSVTKSFTGFVITEEDLDHETNSLERLCHVMPEDLIAVSSAKPILGEFRFVIADGEVVTGSAYSWDNRQDVRSDVTPESEALAKAVASREWQADRVYTCDVGITDLGGVPTARLLELNAFSCSGLYACDTVKIAEKVSEATYREFQMDG